MASYPEREMLTRKEAADYLTRRHFRVSVSTLNKFAGQDDGPPYLCRGPKGGGEAFYFPADLDQWARAYLRKPNTKPRGRVAIA
jgi:hypothetical protein